MRWNTGAVRRVLVARIALAVTLLVALAPAAALAQGANPFGPLPPAPQPTVEPEPVQRNNPDDEDVSRETLFLIGLGVLTVFAGIGMYITRDARRSLTADDRRDLDRELRGEVVRKQQAQAKQRARAKGKAQRRARRAARRR